MQYGPCMRPVCPASLRGGRDGRIRTGDLSVPNAARCQAAPHPVPPILAANRSRPIRGDGLVTDPLPDPVDQAASWGIGPGQGGYDPAGTVPVDPERRAE